MNSMIRFFQIESIVFDAKIYDENKKNATKIKYEYFDWKKRMEIENKSASTSALFCSFCSGHQAWELQKSKLKWN